MKTYCIIITALLAIFATLVLMPNSPFVKVDTVEVIKRDTIITRDTIRLPPPKPERQYIVRTDTIYHRLPNDTIFIEIPIPITQKEYKTADYFAVVEGYNPRLVKNDIYQKEVTIIERHTVKKKPRWGIGVQVGYGLGNGASPYVGIGIQYNIITF